MVKRKAESVPTDLGLQPVSISVRWALSGEIISAVCISPEASVDDLLSALPLDTQELKHLQVLGHRFGENRKRLKATLCHSVDSGHPCQF